MNKELIKFKAVTFNDHLGPKGFYFYNITLPEALDKVRQKGYDSLDDFKGRIAVYPYL